MKRAWLTKSIWVWSVISCLAATGAASSGTLDIPVNESAPLGRPDTFGGYATSHILVRFSPAVSPRENGKLPMVGSGPQPIDNGLIDAANRTWGVTECETLFSRPPRHVGLADKYGLSRTFRLIVPPGTDVMTMVAQYANLPGVELAELDGIGGVAQQIPNDPKFPEQWGLHNTGQVPPGGTPDADVDAPEAWDLTTGSSSILVAVIDTGIQQSHPDLVGRVISGWNTFDNNSNTQDLNGHGTHCAGTIGAIGNNGVGIAGVCWNVNLLAMRCLSAGGSGTESQCAAAIVWAADYGANILSMSLQYYLGSATLHNAIKYADELGALTIAATGNNRGNLVAFPARFPECMGVGGTTKFDLAYNDGNYGPEMDVSAPAVNVVSLWLGGAYLARTGTSMAAPHVSGAAALLKSYRCTLSNSQIRSLLTSTADDLGDAGWDQYFGWGRLNIASAIAAATSNNGEGDLNCDCQIDFFDIEPFILAVQDPAGYAVAYPACNLLRGDMNHDGTVNAFDVQGLVDLMNDF